MSQGRPGKPAQTQVELLRKTAETHQWVGAATIPLTLGQARTVDLRAAVTIKADTRVMVLDAYCGRCKQNWEACAHKPCPAVDPQTNEHLRGGPIGERKKRGRRHRAEPEIEQAVS